MKSAAFATRLAAIIIVAGVIAAWDSALSQTHSVECPAWAPKGWSLPATIWASSF